MLGISENFTSEELSENVGNYVKRWLECGIRKVKITDFEVRKAGPGMFISALCEGESEELIEDGIEFGGLSGQHKATGMYGKVMITYVPNDNIQKGMIMLSADTSSIAKSIGKFDEASKMNYEKPEDPEELIKNYLKALTPIFKDQWFYAKINGKQKGKYTNLSFNRGYTKIEGDVVRPSWLEADKKSIPTAISVYNINEVKDVQYTDDELGNSNHILTLNSGKKSEYNKIVGKNNFSYTWDEEASSEAGRVPEPTVEKLAPPSIDDLPF